MGFDLRNYIFKSFNVQNTDLAEDLLTFLKVSCWNSLEVFTHNDL
jgi:hypothetical protein